MKPAMIQMKQFRTEEALRCGVSGSTIHNRIYGGGYPGLRIKRINKRVVFVMRKPQVSN